VRGLLGGAIEELRAIEISLNHSDQSAKWDKLIADCLLVMNSIEKQINQFIGDLSKNFPEAWDSVQRSLEKTYDNEKGKT
jgi:hypothetical protein